MSAPLGRGLNSLIPNKKIAPMPAQGDAAGLSSSAAGAALEVGLELIDINPYQPRKQFVDSQLQELADSIKTYGVIQPLLVSKKDGGRYELIAGERRLRASKMAGKTTVPVIFHESAGEQKLELALIENIQRENLNPIDLGTAYQRLIDDFHLTQEQVAQKVGKSRPSVANSLRMLRLPEEIKLALIDGKISEGHAKYLMGLDSETKQMSLFRRIIHNNLSVMDANIESKRMGGTKNARVKINYADKDKEFAFREFFGAKVEIRRKGKGGQVIIDFFSEEELLEFVKKIKK